ncbi:hypothetical protein MHUMG1_09923 [Metarhizium humberi]|uniref:Uncharacterized protein n=1 Tax=Metarhizium humberi TaxID=2596975 RepID=A0A9P8M280_9HYPO|nr:hypothetical protein MHUMG1_09923 [Metarhizium humberi]
MVSHPRIGSDTQIKIWSIRIELSDMESNIIAASGAPLRQAMATLHGQGDGGFLVAHVVFAPVQSPSGVKYAGAAGSLDKSSLSGIPSSEPPQAPGAWCLLLPSLFIECPSATAPRPTAKVIKGHSDASQADGKGAGNHKLTATMVQLTRLWHEVLGAHGCPAFDNDLTPVDAG